MVAMAVCATVLIARTVAAFARARKYFFFMCSLPFLRYARETFACFDNVLDGRVAISQSNIGVVIIA